MNKTKLTSLLLAALTLLSAAACSAGTSTEDTGTTAPADTTAEAVTTEAPAPYYLDALSDKTFDGAVFTMIGEDYEQRPNFCLQEYTGVTINDAVYERQLALEARYDIDIEYRSETSRGNCNTTVITTVKADDDTYDLIFNAMTEGAASLVVQNVLTDMAALPYLNFEKPWWSQTMLGAFTYKDHVYLAVGGSSPQLLPLRAGDPVQRRAGRGVRSAESVRSGHRRQMDRG